MPGLVVSDLSLTEGGRWVFREISFNVQPGEVLCLLAPLGSGKTTLLRCIAGLVQPSRGTVLVDSEDVTELFPDERNMAFVSEGSGLFPGLDVAGNIAFGLKARGMAGGELETRIETTKEVLEIGEVSLDEMTLLDERRISLARAAAVKPRILLVDEPFTGLHEGERHEVRRLIRGVARWGTPAVVCATRFWQEALGVSDKVAVMSRGNLLQCDRPEEVYRRPWSESVALLTGPVNAIGAKVLSVENGEARCMAGSGFIINAYVGEESELSEGMEVRLLFRPDAVTMTPATGGANETRGTVIEREFLGMFSRYLVEVGNVQVKAVQQAVGERTPVGASVSIGVFPADVQIISEQ